MGPERHSRRGQHSGRGRGNAPGGRGRGGAGGGGGGRRNFGSTPRASNSNGGHDGVQSEPMDGVVASNDIIPPLSVAVPQDTPRFADLAGQNLVHPTVLNTITNELGFDHMLPVQAATLRELLPPSRSDCLVQAKTGTGKTVAFLLPAIQTMINLRRPKNDRGVSVLVISPTRELAMQINAEATRLLQKLPEFRVCTAMGGTNKDRESDRIYKGCDILIATPGRLLDHLSDENMQHLFRHLDTIVLDEADRLLDMGFMGDIKKIVASLPDKSKTNRQGMLFSATVPPRVQEVSGIVLSPGYKFISTIPEGEANTHERVPQILIKVDNFSQTAAALVGAIREEAAAVAASEGNPPFKAIVFAPTAALADFYEHILSSLSGLPPVSVLHSRQSQSKRTKVTNDFRNAQSAIICTTDVIARGMDFPGVTSVLQAGLPADKESYIHRLGRTARAGAEGRGILILCEAEAWFPQYSLREFKMQSRPANLSFAGDVAAIASKLDEEEQTKVYRAWLGFYKNYCKQMKWSLEELVQEANTFASDGLQAPETPTLIKTLVGKMGLKGVKGLKVVPAPPRQPGGNRGGGGGGGRGGGRQRGGQDRKA